MHSGRVSECEDVCLVGCEHYHLWIDPHCVLWMGVRFNQMGQLVEVHAYHVWEQRGGQPFQLRGVRMAMILEVIWLEVKESELTLWDLAMN